MFANAIELVGEYTRPLKTIMRHYKSNTIIPGAATLFFVNNEGWAITCKHVANLLIQADDISERYQSFISERKQLDVEIDQSKEKLLELENKYQYSQKSIVQIKNQLMDCVMPLCRIDAVLHPIHDLAILHFSGYEHILYNGHAVFAKDGNRIRPGDYLCRLGYPFPEFNDYIYIPENDDIQWIEGTKNSTPRFPIDGMFTRHLVDANGDICGIELSTPGLKGQSGGPLFNRAGVVFGMQYETHHLHLGFDMVNQTMWLEGESKQISNQPFLHVGHCIHVDIIKAFLNEQKVKYYIGNTVEEEEEING